MSEVGEVVPSKTVTISDVQVDLSRAAESDTLPPHFLRVPAVDTVFLLLSVSCQGNMLNWRLLCWSRTVATRRRGCTDVDFGKLTHQVGVERLAAVLVGSWYRTRVLGAVEMKEKERVDSSNVQHVQEYALPVFPSSSQNTVCCCALIKSINAAHVCAVVTDRFGLAHVLFDMMAHYLRMPGHIDVSVALVDGSEHGHDSPILPLL